MLSKKERKKIKNIIRGSLTLAERAIKIALEATDPTIINPKNDKFEERKRKIMASFVEMEERIKKIESL